MDHHNYSEAAASKLALEDRIALRLGRMTMRFAAAESMTRFVLIRVLDVHEDECDRIEVILAELPFRKLRSALLAAGREQLGESNESWKSLKGILAQLAKIEDRRNTLVHSSWNYSLLPSKMAREKRHVASSGRFRSEAEAFEDLAMLDAFVADINAATSEISRWYATQYLGVSAMSHGEGP